MALAELLPWIENRREIKTKILLLFLFFHGIIWGNKETDYNAYKRKDNGGILCTIFLRGWMWNIF